MSQVCRCSSTVIANKSLNKLLFDPEKKPIFSEICVKLTLKLFIRGL